MLDASIIEGFVNTVLVQGFDQPTKTPEFHKELWELCTSSHKLVAIAAPRGHAKSTALTHAYTLAAVLFREAQFVLLVSDTEAQAIEFLGDIKKELETNENLKALFSVKQLSKSSETNIVCEMEDGYLFRIVAKGSEQKVRGLKWAGKRPDLIICDDLENDEIVMNQDRRDKFKRWFRGALMPARSPEGKVRIVGTILHMGSMLNDLMPKPWIKSIIKTPLKLYDSNPKLLWKSVKYRAHDEDFSNILWKERFDEKRLKEIKQEYTESGFPDVYSQEYLNEPLDESVAFFRRSDFVGQTEEEKDKIRNKIIPLLYYAGADLAISEKERADFSVIHVVGVDSNNVIYHVNTIRQRMDGREIVDTIMRLHTQYDLQWLAIESEKIAKSLGPFLREEMLSRNKVFHIEEIVPSADKRTRARSIQGRMRIGSVKFDKDADYYPQLESEFLRFPRDVHDDQVDAYSVIGLALEKIATANTFEEQVDDEFELEKEETLTGGHWYNDGRSYATGY